MSKWVGYAVSVNCGETLGCYQGTILEADGLTITLTKAFRNGFPYPKSQVTLNAADIKDLRIIEAKSERTETHSTVAPTASRKSRATVCETLKANPTSTGNQTSSNNANSNIKSTNSRNINQAAPPRTKPVEILAPRIKNHNNHSGSYGSGSTPKSRGNGFGGRGESTGIPGGAGGAGGAGAGHDKARRRNEACFGDAAEPALDDDFDFEGNLALFDKRAVWASMRNSKPDVVRTADESKYRHDENVLGGAAGAGGAGGAEACCVPAALSGASHYVTDGGAVVRSVTPALRRQLWRALQRHGLADSALTLVARAAADVALSLVGGGRRLEPRNAHQPPSVLSVCGAHRGGAAGALAARLLASRGAVVRVLLAGGAAEGAGGAALQRELAALRLDGVPVLARAAELPARADLVLVALHDPLEAADAGQYAEELAWVATCRAAVLAVEPSGDEGAGGGARACVLGVACVPLPASLGRVYLADVAAPQQLFAERGLRYRPPFGAAAALPLHPHEP